MRAYTIIGVLGLGLGCWVTGALAQSADSSGSDSAYKGSRLEGTKALPPLTADQLPAEPLASIRSSVTDKDVSAKFIVSSEELAKLLKE